MLIRGYRTVSLNQFIFKLIIVIAINNTNAINFEQTENEILDCEKVVGIVGGALFEFHGFERTNKKKWKLLDNQQETQCPNLGAKK